MASSPDDAGHRGSNTLPEDTLRVQADGEWPSSPPLHRDPAMHRGSSIRTVLMIAMAMIVLLLCILALFYYAPF